MAADDVVKPSSTLPPYPEMICAAISVLNEKDGSNKSAISKHLESTYGDQLPEGHSALLTAHLVRMKDSGELIFVKNNYIKAGPDAPLKRGRGRPPKSKSDDPSAVANSPSSPKSRGRPPKPKDPLAAAIAKAAKGYPGRRGRPPKVASAPGAGAVVAPAGDKLPLAPVGPVTGVKRGRGRPPKVKTVAVAVEAGGEGGGL